ncbi:hypothetical protein EX30DRAFT_368860 [Ascodesmis nigricans]|uniref:Uncharacterized protein n=1 Tax=Ascodesmis nigricans TaxID=341454 RepID=A0A4S2N2Y7_9PEZI|nr:hypothetical protein EX30DRAFT_368860 [Ascodesmis nigricans]
MSARVQKRPYSARDLVHDLSSAELQQLVDKAIQRDTIPLKTEIEAPKATVVRLAGFIQYQNSKANADVSPASQKRLASEQEGGGSWKTVISKKKKTEIANASPNNKATNAERRFIIERKKEGGSCPTSKIVVAMNATLSKAIAPPHIRIQKIEVNGKGAFNAKMGHGVTEIIALQYNDRMRMMGQGAGGVEEELRRPKSEAAAGIQLYEKMIAALVEAVEALRQEKFGDGKGA